MWNTGSSILTTVHTVCQFIHRTWRSSYFFEWQAGAVHSSVHANEVLPRRNLHVLLHHRSEVPLRQSMAAVLVEVRSAPPAIGVLSSTMVGGLKVCLGRFSGG